MTTKKKWTWKNQISLFTASILFISSLFTTPALTWFNFNGAYAMSVTPTMFTHKGKVETYTIIQSGAYDLIAFGAQGRAEGGMGGKGGQARGTYELKAGDVVKVIVGGQDGYNGGGGYNEEDFLETGGGATHIYVNDVLYVTGAGGGGGLTGTDGGTGTSEGGKENNLSFGVSFEQGKDGINGGGGSASSNLPYQETVYETVVVDVPVSKYEATDIIEGKTVTFSTSTITYEVQKDGTYRLTGMGAQGEGNGGKGGSASADFSLSEGDMLYVTTGGSDGFNGGGNGYYHGGGATTIALNSPTNVLIQAGGGGAGIAELTGGMGGNGTGFGGGGLLSSNQTYIGAYQDLLEKTKKQKENTSNDLFVGYKKASLQELMQFIGKRGTNGGGGGSTLAMIQVDPTYDIMEMVPTKEWSQDKDGNKIEVLLDKEVVTGTKEEVIVSIPSQVGEGGRSFISSLGKNQEKQAGVQKGNGKAEITPVSYRITTEQLKDTTEKMLSSNGGKGGKNYINSKGLVDSQSITGAQTGDGFAQVRPAIEQPTETMDLDSKEPSVQAIFKDGVTYSYVTPQEGDYLLETWGAQGQESGGMGGYATGTIHLEKGEKLFILVGGQNGYNGGGEGYYNGGGASEIRLNTNSTANRIIVAGGGGAYTDGTDGGEDDSKGGLATHNLNGGSGNGFGGGGASYPTNGIGSGTILYTGEFIQQAMKKGESTLSLTYINEKGKEVPRLVNNYVVKSKAWETNETIEEEIHGGHGGKNFLGASLITPQEQTGVNTGDGKVTVTLLEEEVLAIPTPMVLDESEVNEDYGIDTLASTYYSQSFSSGSSSYRIPADGVYRLSAYGAQGSGGGGYGGYASGDFTLSAGEVVYTSVGSQTGGGYGEYYGGGATQLTVNSYSVIGAGGGGGYGGGAGGNGSGSGGYDVGKGSGGSGYNGSGGGQSYSWNEEIGYWKPTYKEVQVTKCVMLPWCEYTGTASSKDYSHCGIHNTATGCSDTSSPTSRQFCAVTTNTVYDKDVWVFERWQYHQGIGGYGGSSSVSSSASNRQMSSGAKSGSGSATVSSVNLFPILTINSPSNLALYQPTQTVTYTGTVTEYDSTGTLRLYYQVDNGTAVPFATKSGTGTHSWSFSIVTKSTDVGPYNVKVWAVDSDGGSSKTQERQYDVNDIYPPTLSLTPSTTLWTNQNVTVTAYATDNYQIKGITLPSGSMTVNPNGLKAPNRVGPTSFSATYSAVGNGSYTFSVSDFYGNTTKETISIQNIDKTAPTIQVTRLNPSSTWTNEPATYRVSITDALSGFNYYTVSGDSQKYYENNTNYQIGANGTYTFTAYDKAGNAQTTSVTVSYIDTVNPTAPTISVGKGWQTSTTVTGSFVGSTDSTSGLSHYEYRLEGAQVTDWTVGSTVVITQEGITDIYVHAVDKAGNHSSESKATVQLDKSNVYNNYVIIHPLTPQD